MALIEGVRFTRSCACIILEKAQHIVYGARRGRPLYQVLCMRSILEKVQRLVDGARRGRPLYQVLRLVRMRHIRVKEREIYIYIYKEKESSLEV